MGRIVAVTGAMTSASLGSSSCAFSLPTVPAKIRAVTTSIGMPAGIANAHRLVPPAWVVPTPMPLTPVHGRNKLAIPRAAPATLSPKATSSVADSLWDAATGVSGDGAVIGAATGMVATDMFGREPGRRPTMDEFDGWMVQAEGGSSSAGGR